MQLSKGSIVIAENAAGKLQVENLHLDFRGNVLTKMFPTQGDSPYAFVLKLLEDLRHLTLPYARTALPGMG